MYDIALVGSAGFLGTAIGTALRAQGHRVTGFTRSEPLVEGETLSPAAEGAAVVVWAAGGVSPVLAERHPELVERELTHFEDAVTALARQAAPPRLVLLSSGGTVYGSSAVPPFREGAELAPEHAYGRYKLDQERIAAASGLASTALRIANAYGPGQRGAGGQGVLAVWLRSVLAGDPVLLYGNGGVARDYVFVDDVADAVGSCVRASDAPVALNIGAGVPTTLDELAERLRGVVAPHPVEIERRESRGVDATSNWLDVSLAERRISWVARTSLDEGIERMWRWVSAT